MFQVVDSAKRHQSDHKEWPQRMDCTADVMFKTVFNTEHVFNAKIISKDLPHEPIIVIVSIHIVGLGV